MPLGDALGVPPALGERGFGQAATQCPDSPHLRRSGAMCLWFRSRLMCQLKTASELAALCLLRLNIQQVWHGHMLMGAGRTGREQPLPEAGTRRRLLYCGRFGAAAAATERRGHVPGRRRGSTVARAAFTTPSSGSCIATGCCPVSHLPTPAPRWLNEVHAGLERASSACV